MRRTLNENPVAQAALIGVLALAAGFMLLTRMSGGAEEAPQAEAPASSAAVAAQPAEPVGTTDAAVPTPAAEAAPGVQAVAGEFEAGEGLPAKVVGAHQDGDAVVLLFTRKNGIEDQRLRRTLERVREIGEVSAFHAYAGEIARYSRIAGGVDVSRVPALVVVQPPEQAVGGVPVATVSYGFRGSASAEQAVRDALYDGRTGIPYHPYPE